MTDLAYWIARYQSDRNDRRLIRLGREMRELERRIREQERRAAYETATGIVAMTFARPDPIASASAGAC